MKYRLTDEQYKEGLLKRDSFILEHIYQELFPGIAKHVLEHNGSQEDAEDVFQEGLMVLYRKAKGDALMLSSSFYTFLYAVCKRIWLKKKSRRKGRLALSLEEAELIQLAEDATLILEQSEQYALYRSKFELLGEACQQVLRLFFSGESMVEIAKEMGFSDARYAKKRKFICKEQLVKLIKSDSRYQELR
ncbi:MAG: sigma-70 family RNA polymerase sigma factor [Saprospiraceae bacterium]|nr:sigma-70 family RNA polymerase sigma factor [Saprospiraceae bacterium]